MNLQLLHWSARFEEETGWLRDIRWGGAEVLRGVYAAVRDEQWGTAPPQIRDLRVRRDDAEIAIEFAAWHLRPPIDFRWRGRILLHAAGILRYDMNGQAHSDFLRNRIGFCVLHPPACAGGLCRVEHIDGRITEGFFPDAIAPHQPFKDIRSIRHVPAAGVTATVRLEGDTFEMEDQRNWSDASFKTYCTPLDLPHPMRICRGTRVEQSVELRVTGAAPPAKIQTPVIELHVADDPPRPLPQIGLGFADADLARASWLASLHPAHGRVEIPADAADALPRLRRFATLMADLNTDLEVALILTRNAVDEILALSEALRRHPLPRAVKRWILHQGPDRPADIEVLTLARTHLSGSVGAGVLTNFTELNRCRPPVTADFAAFALNPQVHAFDDLSLRENLSMQEVCVRNAQRFISSGKIVVAPVTLAGRGRWDSRQTTPFAAAWTLGSLDALGAAGVASVTYGQGLHDFMTAAGQPLPVGRLFQSLEPFHGGTMRPVHSSDPFEARAILLEHGSRRRILVALWGERPVCLTASGQVQWIAGTGTTTRRGSTSTLTPTGYAVCGIDLE